MHNLDERKFLMMITWSSKRVSKKISLDGTKGCSAGQSGDGLSCFELFLVFAAALVRVFDGILLVCRLVEYVPVANQEDVFDYVMLTYTAVSVAPPMSWSGRWRSWHFVSGHKQSITHALHTAVVPPRRLS